MVKQNQLIRGDVRKLNSYDMMYNAVSRKPAFHQEEWVNAANNGTLDSYVNLLLKSDSIDYDAFKQKYNLDFADSKTRAMALYTELEADRENVNEKRKKTVDTPDGPVEQEYVASDYEYNLSLIREHNDYNKLMVERAQIQNLKDGMSAWDHIAGAGLGAITSVTSGVLSAIDNMSALVGGVVSAIGAEKGQRTDAFVQSVASDKWRAFADVSEQLVDFESRYTSMRDIDGNYSDYGKYLGGALTSLGEMIPSMLIGMGVGGLVGKAAGATSKIATTAASVTSRTTFYAGMAAGTIQDTYRQFEANGADVDSAHILANSAIKSAMQFGVEYLLGKAFGATSLDNMVFGSTMTSTTGKNLTQAGVKNLFKDVLQEGLEEVLQDTSDFLVDRAYGIFINEFKDVTDISFQSLFDAFVLGGLMSFAGSARNIIGAKNVYAGDKKLNKIASWQYGLNLQSYMESLEAIDKATHHVDRRGEIGPAKFNLDSKSAKAAKAAILESYASYRMISSVYQEIGDERFKAANEILDKITDKIKSGFFEISDVNSYVDTIKGQLKGMAESSIKKIAAEMQDAGVSEVKETIEVSDEKALSSDAVKIKAKALADTLGAQTIAITDGGYFKKVGDTVIVSENKLNKSVGELMTTQAVNDLADSIVSNFSKGPVLDKLYEAFESYYGRKVSSTEAVLALFYDKDFYASTLLNGNKDVYKLLSYFVELGNKLRTTVAFSAVQKHALTNIIKNWTESLTEFCIIHPEADPSLFFYAIDSDRRKAVEDRIKRERWGGLVYRTVIDNPSQLTDTDRKVLRNRVDRVFSKDAADRLWDNLLSPYQSTRQAAMNALSAKYEGLFNSDYDGTVYLTDTSVPNRRFNRFLRDKRLTVKTLLRHDKLTESEKAFIISNYAEITDLTILQLRKSQFAEYSPNCTFEYTNNGSINVYSNEKMVGFGELVQSIDDVIRVKNNKELSSRTLTYDTAQRSDLLTSLLSDSLPEINRKFITVTDLIENPDLFNENIKSKIIDYNKKIYGIEPTYISEEMVVNWLSNYLITATETKGLIALDDGSFAIGDTVTMSEVFNDKYDLSEDSTLETIFKSKYIPDGLRLQFIDGDGTAYFQDVKNENIDGKNVQTIDNTIYIPKTFLKFSKATQKFVLAHELQHAIQFDKYMNHGFAYNWASMVSDKLFNQIVQDVKRHVPHLFEGGFDAVGERAIVEAFVYYGSGEAIAYGLGRNRLLDFYPVIIKTTPNGKQITMPWGTQFKITDSDIKTNSDNISDKVSHLINNSTFKDYFSLKSKLNVRAMMDRSNLNNKRKQLESILYDNAGVQAYLGHGPYDRNILSTIKTIVGKAFLMDNNKLKNISNQLLYSDLQFNDAYSSFLEYDLPFIAVDHPSMSKVFKTAVVGSNQEDLVNQATKFVMDLNLGLDKVSLSYGTIKPKDIYGYVKADGVKQLIIPSNVMTQQNAEDVKFNTTIPETIALPQDDGIRPPNKNEIAEDDPRAKHFVKAGASTHPTYLARYLVIDDKGNQVLRQGKYAKYNYVYPEEKTNTRKVGQRKWKGTKLEPFTKQYETTQMSKELQDFILKAEGLDPILQNKIDGKLAGTLTEKDVKDYLRSKDKIDDKTFKAINDAFYQNEYIDNFDELMDLIKDAPQAWALWRTAKNSPNLKEIFEATRDRELDLKTLQDLILNDDVIDEKGKSPSKRYTTYLGEWMTIEGAKTTRDLDIPAYYMRIHLMKNYDGSIETLRHAASSARMTGIYEDAWNRTEQDNRLNQAFHDATEEVIDDAATMSDDELIMLLSERKLIQMAKTLNEEYNDDIPFESKERMKREVRAYTRKLYDLSRSELIKLLGGARAMGAAILENVVMDATGNYVQIDKKIEPKASTYVNRMKGAVRTIKNNLDGSQQKALAKQYDDLFDANLNVRTSLYKDTVNYKTRAGQGEVMKPIEDVIKVFERVEAIKNEVLLNRRSIKRELALEKRKNQEQRRIIKQLEAGVKKDGKTPHVVEIVTDDDSEHLVVEKEMPLPMLKLLQVHYNKTAKTSVQNLSSENERHQKRVANDFYENADEILLNLTQKDVDDIIDFMVNGIVNFNDATAPYQVGEMLIRQYLIQVGRTGTITLRSKDRKTNNPLPVNFVISEKQLRQLEDLQQKRISRSATVLAHWRDVLHMLDPVQTIMQSIARKSGVTPTEEEVKKLMDAAKTGDAETIAKTKKHIYDSMRQRLSDKEKSTKGLDKWLDKLLQWERLAMLSAPGTWVRNATSNTIVQGVNWTADKVMPGLDNILYKLFPKSTAVENQYKIAGTKIDDDVAEYIKIKLIDSGLLDMSIEGISKYDTRRSLRGVENATVLTEMLTNAAISVANSSQLFVNKPFSEVEKFIKKMISDDKWVRSATKVYLGKMITEDIANSEKVKSENEQILAYNNEIRKLNRGRPKSEWEHKLKKTKDVRVNSKAELLSTNEINKDFLVYVAEAYKMAAYDYMHRDNALLAFESKLAHKNYKAYVMYKQVFPFAGAGWNWFVEGLNYTPIGLVKAIVNFAKLENTVEKMDVARQNFKHGSIGLSSDFAAYITKRNITKGVIGSIGFIAGALLAAFGVIRIDEEDEVYKLTVGDVAIDISDIFGTQGILLGATIVGGIRNQDSFGDLCVATLDQMFMDSTFSDVFNTFRYNDTFGEFLTYQAYALPNMLIPNFLKMLSSMAEPHDIQFNPGIVGKLQRLASNAIPGLSHGLPHYYDPYTGTKQVPQKLWFLTKLIDKLTPLGLSIYNISEHERRAIKYGINKTQLTGKYNINDTVVKLNGRQIEALNEYYGKLNASSLADIESSRKTYRIQKEDGTYKTVKWSQLNEKEKAAVVDRIMTNNSGYAKIYILTDSNNYKYYASPSEYKELKSLGLTKNIYKASGKNRGFVKIN